MSKPTVGVALGLLLLVGVLAISSNASVGPRLSLIKLRTCLSGDGQEDVGVRSFGYTVYGRLDDNAVELIVVSGHNPRPGRITAILTTGRKPRSRVAFANVVITAFGPFVHDSPGFKRPPKTLTQLIHDVDGDIATCVARSR